MVIDQNHGYRSESFFKNWIFVSTPFMEKKKILLKDIFISLRIVANINKNWPSFLPPLLIHGKTRSLNLLFLPMHIYSD